MNRRGFLQSCLALGAAPAIVRADSLMRIVAPETIIVPGYRPFQLNAIEIDGRSFAFSEPLVLTPGTYTTLCVGSSQLDINFSSSGEPHVHVRVTREVPPRIFRLVGGRL